MHAHRRALWCGGRSGQKAGVLDSGNRFPGRGIGEPMPSVCYYYWRIIISSNCGPNHKAHRAHKGRTKTGLTILAGPPAAAPVSPSLASHRCLGRALVDRLIWAGACGVAAMSPRRAGLPCMWASKELEAVRRSRRGKSERSVFLFNSRSWVHRNIKQ
jgi:hypothetical protein